MVQQPDKKEFIHEAQKILLICKSRLLSSVQMLEDDKFELYESMQKKFEIGFNNFKSLDYLMQTKGYDLMQDQKAFDLLQDIQKAHTEMTSLLEDKISCMKESVVKAHKHSHGLKHYGSNIKEHRFIKVS